MFGSTLDFRYQYARSAWDAERSAWRSVIQLNVVRSVLTVLDALQAQVDGVNTGQDQISSTPTDSLFGVSENIDEPSSSSALAISTVRRTESSQSLHNSAAFKHPLALPAPPTIKGLTTMQSGALLDTYNSLKDRLECLRTVEVILMRRLGAGGTEDYGDASSSALGVLGRDDEDEAGAGISDEHLRGRRDARVHSRGASRSQTPVGGEGRAKREWGVQRLQDALSRSSLSDISPRRSAKGKEPASGDDVTDDADDEPTRVLAESKEAMQSLWANDEIRVVLNKRKVRVEDTAGL